MMSEEDSAPDIASRLRAAREAMRLEEELVVPPPPKSFRRWIVGGAAALMLVALGGGVYALNGTWQGSDDSPAAAPPPAAAAQSPSVTLSLQSAESDLSVAPAVAEEMAPPVAEADSAVPDLANLDPHLPSFQSSKVAGPALEIDSEPLQVAAVAPPQPQPPKPEVSEADRLAAGAMAIAADVAALEQAPTVTRNGGSIDIDLGGLPLAERDPALPAWQRYALDIPDPASKPMIAIVLDDLGLNRRGTRAAIELPGPLTLAFMTYAEGLKHMAAKAQRAGHELMLHVPMEPEDLQSNNPGPNVLTTGLPQTELSRRLDWGLGRYEGFVGINNHMGSRFTADRAGMTLVMQELKSRGLLFLDSMTSGRSVGAEVAAEVGVPYAERDIFLDNTPGSEVSIWAQLGALEAEARHQGFAVGIGHPHEATVRVLAKWLPEIERRGFVLVPISAIVRHRQELALRRAEGTG